MSETINNVNSDFETSKISFNDFREIILHDYKIAVQSRYVSVLGRKEVLTGKAKFGIFGDGKEVAQIALSKVFKNGDWRSGYYRDQTFAFASEITNVYHFFSQLYANPDLKSEISSGGRQMNCHFSTQLLDGQGNWLNQTEQKNSVSDISTTGGQMARVVGLGLASKLYRENRNLDYLSYFSNKGEEVVFAMIGNASTSEGVFWETLNAIAVKQIPVVVSIWDDGYGISVPNEVQTTKGDISAAIRGLQREGGSNGVEIFKVRGWDYPALCEVYEKAALLAREEHIPCVVHVTEMTQPQGHSTSGSHERYKTDERLAWEESNDCNLKMREWLLTSGIAQEEELLTLEKDSKEFVRQEQRRAWADCNGTIRKDLDEAIEMLAAIELPVVEIPLKTLKSLSEPSLKIVYANVRRAIRDLRSENSIEKTALVNWYTGKTRENYGRFNDKLFSDTKDSPLDIAPVAIVYNDAAQLVDGREILNACFKANFARDERIIAFGEDVGLIGDVNQGFAGLQDIFGEQRIFDTGIRESVIVGKGIGLAIRGLRPIAEIQYLDYLLYGLPVLSDDLASLSYRTKGTQKSPVIIRTRGHRLEGVWHSGSPMTVLLGALRGIHLCVPRNMTQAAGMYNTLLRSDEPALVIECLNGYRLKEKMPSNVGEFTVEIGQTELMREGTDITVISYGATLRVVMDASVELEKLGISIEVIDAQCLLPFDRTNLSSKSLAKTNKILVVDEDMPGGASAFIMNEVLENQNGYYLLDGQPKTLSAKAHRPPYGSDGDYFTKPSIDDIVEVAYQMMSDYNGNRFPKLF
ncbi:MAG: alpha-ketoacid dehydrogenase subunit alpha/beta [Sphingobacterium sp.]|uniref:alpha-ketoacid dehydrogenase subunit alpha/beta n=1 Tax=Sphingobacterium sp. JB170 TaxID=1434842 RepID=UPI00097EF8E7|nr:alpha-ketoacid dehydrogenase subunit alpha/beta [Sphingobacterium sp. JB170]SJN45444.1 Branched-chain alpha-keto acid dehydrogenase, E1 component, alpha subunit / Branched-chain alpha-keto acid dehydrogenase, E1 component, beta subunit [Sphingobacterium sp. JB170]